MAAALFSIGATAALDAQTPAPSPAPTARPNVLPTIPPNADQLVRDLIQLLSGSVTGALGLDSNRAVGTVTYFRRYDMQIRLQLSKYRDVHLHQGTVINPRGATIQTGQLVDVVGRARSDGSLDADQITVH
jgi:hypothetical protein